MLSLTDNARAAVEDLTAKAGIPNAGGLRIAESPDAKGDFELALVEGPEVDDAVVDTGDTHVFVESGTVEVLADLMLDTDPEHEPDQAHASFILTPKAV